jgi:hypothetical protein
MSVPSFLLFFVFQKSYTRNILEIGRNKSRPPIFPHTRRSPKMRQKGARGRPHPRTAWPGPGPRHQGVSPPGPPPNAALPPIYSPQREKPKARSIFHETKCKPPPSSTRDREGPEALPGTLPERAITARGLLHHHGRLQSDVWVVYLGLRVHSSS